MSSTVRKNIFRKILIVDWKGEKYMIIDTHLHIGGEAVGFEMNEQMVVEAMEKYQIAYGLVSNADAAEMTHQQVLLPDSMQNTQEDCLKRVLHFAKNYPNKIGACVWVKPYLQGVTKELEQLIADNLDLIYAIKLHPFHSNVAPTDERVLPYLSLAEKYGLAVVSHTGGCEAASPKHLYEAAKLFPKVPFVMVHMGLGTDNREAVDLLGKADNLYGDTTWVPMATTIEVIRRYGSERMLFGSDAPIDGVDTYFCNPKGERSIYQDYFHVLKDKMSKEAYENLMYKNAMRIFKIKELF